MCTGRREVVRTGHQVCQAELAYRVSKIRLRTARYWYSTSKLHKRADRQRLPTTHLNTHLAPVQANKPLTTQTIKLAPTLPTLATMTPGLENIPEPTCIPTTNPIACHRPTCLSSSPAASFSFSPERVRGKRECSNSNPAPPKDVTVLERSVRGLASSAYDSESSSARRDNVGERSDWGVRGGEGELLSGLYAAILFYC